jgi:hypothetical protein
MDDFSLIMTSHVNGTGQGREKMGLNKHSMYRFTKRWMAIHKTTYENLTLILRTRGLILKEDAMF